MSLARRLYCYPWRAAEGLGAARQLPCTDAGGRGVKCAVKMRGLKVTTWVVIAVVSAVWNLGQLRGPVAPRRCFFDLGASLT